MCIYIDDLNACNLKQKCSTTKLLKQGNRYHKLSNALSKFYRRHHELVSKFNVRLKVKSMQRSGKSATRGDQFVPIGMPTICLYNLLPNLM